MNYARRSSPEVPRCCVCDQRCANQSELNRHEPVCLRAQEIERAPIMERPTLDALPF